MLRGSPSRLIRALSYTLSVCIHDSRSTASREHPVTALGSSDDKEYQCWMPATKLASKILIIRYLCRLTPSKAHWPVVCTYLVYKLALEGSGVHAHARTVEDSH